MGTYWCKVEAFTTTTRRHVENCVKLSKAVATFYNFTFTRLRRSRPRAKRPRGINRKNAAINQPEGRGMMALERAMCPTLGLV